MKKLMASQELLNFEVCPCRFCRRLKAETITIKPVFINLGFNFAFISKRMLALRTTSGAWRCWGI